MRTKDFYSIFIGLGLVLFSFQKAEAQSGLQYMLLQGVFDQIVGTTVSSGIDIPINTEIEITEDNYLQVAPANSPKTTYFEDNDGDGYTSGKTLEDIPGLDIPGYKEIMFLNVGSLVQDMNSDISYWVFDCDDTNPIVIRGFLFYEDKDGDGYITNSPPITACERPEGYISEENIKGYDCDDTTFDTEKPTTTYYLDGDGDGYPNSSSGGEYCERPEGYKTAEELISTKRDCNDNNKDTWESLVYYQDSDGDGYVTYSSAVCIGAVGPTRDEVIQSILDAGYEYGFPILGYDCDDTAPQVGAYQPINFVKTKLGSVSIDGCSLDAVENGTRPVFSTEYTTTTLDVLLAAGAVLADGYCSIKRVRYFDYLLPSSVKEPNAIFFRRSFLVVDQYDNIAFFARTYIIRDQSKPTIEPLASLTLNNDPGSCGATKVNINLINPVTSDNCTQASELTYSNNAPEIFTIGENLVEWTVTDKSGNIQKVIQKVIIVDNEPPIVKTKNITVSLGLSGTTITPGMIDGGTSDNCSYSFKDFKLPLGCANLGENLVTLTAVDAAGNESSATAIVTLVDNRAPSFILFPEDVSVSCGNIPEVATPGTLDNCNTGVVVSFLESSDQNPDMTASSHYNYVITRTWKAKDTSGNIGERSQKITVSDQLAPSIEQIQNIQASCENIPVAIALGAKDNCDPNPSIILKETSDQNPDDTKVGHYNYTLTRIWTAKDVSGNISERVQLVSVTDSKAPEWSTAKGSLDVTLYCGHESGLESIQNQNPVALDNCDQNPVISKTNGDFIPGALPGSGTYTNIFIATDPSGNESTEFRQIITVIPLTVDASSSSRPLEINTPITLSASVNPQVAGVMINFKVLDDLGQEVFNQTEETEESGIATASVPNLPLGGYEVIASIGNGCTESVAYLPIYDPNGKFVIGAGWISSPVGAVTDQPEVTGKANFGFLSKYKKGSNQVDGDTKFKFNAAGISFESTMHESGSLVISGKKANYRGEGMVNDIPGFKFIVTAIDGQWNGNNDPDQFRIKIWGPTGVIYDNQKGADEYAEACTELGGGSISINDEKSKNKRIEDSLIKVEWNTPFETVQNKLDLISQAWFEGRMLSVQFTSEGYDPMTPGIYQMKGELDENNWVELEEPIIVTVIVLDKPKAQDINLSNSTISKDLKIGSIIGVFNTIDPIDDLHNYTMSEHSEVELIGNQLVLKSLEFKNREVTLTIFSTDRAGQTISKEVRLNREIPTNEFLLYPNPADSETKVFVEMNEGATVSIQLFDASGKLIVNDTTYREETFVQTMNLDGLAPGIFVIQVKIGHIVMSKRLIKN